MISIFITLDKSWVGTFSSYRSHGKGSSWPTLAAVSSHKGCRARLACQQVGSLSLLHPISICSLTAPPVCTLWNSGSQSVVLPWPALPASGLCLSLGSRLACHFSPSSSNTLMKFLLSRSLRFLVIFTDSRHDQDTLKWRYTSLLFSTSLFSWSLSSVYSPATAGQLSQLAEVTLHH